MKFRCALICNRRFGGICRFRISEVEEEEEELFFLFFSAILRTEAAISSENLPVNKVSEHHQQENSPKLTSNTCRVSNFENRLWNS